MIGYTIFIAMLFSSIGSYTTHCVKLRDIHRLVKAHKVEIDSVKMCWYKAGWQDGVLYQRSKQNSIET